MTKRGPLGEVAALFLKLGTTAFGGPAAHVAMMRDEVVTRRQWVDDGTFMDLVGATNLIPGPSSTELAIHLGHQRAGWPGLVVAGVTFIVPAMVLTAICAWAYVTYGAVPEVGAVLYGVKPVVLAIVAVAILGLLPVAARTWPLRGIGVVCVVLAVLGVHELAILFGAGLVLIGFLIGGRRVGVMGAVPLAGGVAGVAAGVSAVTLPGLFWVFAKIGAVLFGSGYVLLAFLRAELVVRLGWLTEGQLIDAIAVGQVTPGPVFTTATFIGWLLEGPAGALVATAGIFLPAFIFVAITAPILPKLRRSPTASAFLDGVNVASLALMAVVSWQLGAAAIVDVVTVVVGLASLVLLVRYKLNATWLVLGGAIVGLIAEALRGPGPS